MKSKIFLLLAFILCLTSGCGSENRSELPANTPTLTPTQALVPTSGAMDESSATPSPTATFAPAATNIPTTEPTPTDTPILTSTPEPTATCTPIPTNTPTPEPTATSTPTPTNTPVPTATPTPSPTNTPTPTCTPKPLPTNTPTPTPSPMPTGTPTPLPEPIGISTKNGRTYIEYPTPTPANDEQKNCSHISTGKSTDIQLINGKYEYFFQSICIRCDLVMRNVVFQMEPFPTVTPRPEAEDASYAIQKTPGNIINQEVNYYAYTLTVTYEDGSSHEYDRIPATYTYFNNGAKYFALFPTDASVVFYRLYKDAKGNILNEEFILKYDKQYLAENNPETALIDSVSYYVYTCIDHTTMEITSFLVNSDGTYNKYSEYKFSNSVCGITYSWTNQNDLNTAQCRQITVYSNGAKVRIDMTKPEELYYYKTDDTYPNLYDEIRLYEK